MTFTARNAATIRDLVLANWRTRYLLLGRDLDIAEGSDAYNEIDALSLEAEGIELGAQEAAHRVLLRFAVGQDLDDFATDDGTARKGATKCRLTVPVVGPASSSTPVAGATLASAGGVRFAPIDPATGSALANIVTDGSGNANLILEAQEPGTASNLPVTTVLTWSTPPTSFGSTATVASVVRLGEDAEIDDALRTRLLERRRERPASGNRADWRGWALDVAGVADAFVHPCALPPDLTAAPARPSIIANMPGNVVVIPVPPAPPADSYVQNGDGTLGQGLSPGYSRRPSAELCTLVAQYIDGTHDANGVAVAESARKQLYPAVLDRENWDAVRPSAVGVEVLVEVSTGVSFAFDGTRTVTAAADASHLTLSSVAGLESQMTLAFRFAALGPDGLPSVIRGGWALGTISNINPGAGTIALAAPLPAIPAVGALVRYDPGVWNAVRAALLKYFDAFGPGAPSGLGRSARFPDKTWGAGADVSRGRLLAAALSVSGLVDAAIIDPSWSSVTSMGIMALPSFITVRQVGGT